MLTLDDPRSLRPDPVAGIVGDVVARSPAPAVIRLIAIFYLVAVTSTIAAAQPALTAPSPVLTADERALLERGEIGEGARLGGVVASVVFGLGTGQAIQGRWKERGWIFTVGELAGFGLAAVAASESDLDQDVITAMAIVGWSSFLGLHVWEVVDAVTVPRRHNRRVREARRRAGYRPTYVLPIVTPAPAGDGAVGGVLVTF